MPAMPLFVLGYVTLASVIAFGVFWWDKRQAGRGGWRVSERTLLLLAAAGGLPGAVIAMGRLRHKTRKMAFKLAMAGIAVLWTALGVSYLYWR